MKTLCGVQTVGKNSHTCSRCMEALAGLIMINVPARVANIRTYSIISYHNKNQGSAINRGHLQHRTRKCSWRLPHFPNHQKWCFTPSVHLKEVTTAGCILVSQETHPRHILASQARNGGSHCKQSSYGSDTSVCTGTFTR